MNVFELAIAIYFFFWVVNYASLIDGVRARVFPKLPQWLGFAITCPFCFTFWLTNFLCVFWLGYSVAVFVTPVIAMFLDLVYRRLK